MSIKQVFFVEFVLYLPKWASGDKKNLCSTLINKSKVKRLVLLIHVVAIMNASTIIAVTFLV